VCEPLKPLLIEEEDGGEKVWRYRKAAVQAISPLPRGVRARAENRSARRRRRGCGSRLRRNARLTVPISPSSAFDEEIGRGRSHAAGSVAERRKALARGRIVHRLMQSLPDIPPAGRKDAIERYLKNAAADFASAEQAAIAQQVLTILNDLIFAEVFAPGSRAEVPIVGRIARAGATAAIAVSGQVDRLAVTADAVLIADYKTDRAVRSRLGGARRPMSASSRSTARCSGAFTRKKRFARHLCSPRVRTSSSSRAAMDAEFGRNHEPIM
jgi:ATP-dependent helicase/nuclease subunit A